MSSARDKVVRERIAGSQKLHTVNEGIFMLRVSRLGLMVQDALVGMC